MQSDHDVHERLAHVRGHSSATWLALVLVTAFLAGNLPVASRYLLHYPDERHYTDAAILMVQHGEYLTPRQPNGTPRLRKPILTYWAVVAGFQLFGIHPLAARVPFLCAAAALLLLTYRLARHVSGSPQTGLLAMCVLLVHPIFVLSATRSIPDILLCLFFCTAAYGLVRLVTCDTPHGRHCLLLYGGTGLAVASKGLPALAMILSACLALALNPWRKVPLRRFWHGPSILAGVLVASGWFGTACWQHGLAALEIFWEDQVGQRVMRRWWEPLVQWPMGLGAMLLMLLPWCLPLIASRRGPQIVRQCCQEVAGWLRSSPGAQAGQWSVEQRAFFALIAFWTLLLSLLIAVVHEFSIRYILPVCPLQAIAVAQLLRKLPASSCIAWMRGTLIVMTGVGLIACGLVLLVEYQFGPTLSGMLGLATLVAGALALLVLGLRNGMLRDLELQPAYSLALLFCLFCSLEFLLLRHLVLPDQGMQITRRLEQLGLLEDAVYYVGKPALASKVRVCSGGRATLVNAPFEDRAELHGEPAVLLRADLLDQVDLSGYDVLPASRGLAELDVSDALHALCAGRLKEVLEQQPPDFVLAVRRPDCIAPLARVAQRSGGEAGQEGPAHRPQADELPADKIFR